MIHQDPKVPKFLLARIAALEAERKLLRKVELQAMELLKALHVGHGDHGPNRCRLCDEMKALRLALESTR